MADIKIAKKHQKKNLPEDFEYIPIPFADGSLLMVDITDKEPIKVGFCHSCQTFVRHFEDYVISWRNDCRCHEKCCPNPESEVCKKCDVFLKTPMGQLVKESIDNQDPEVMAAGLVDLTNK